MPAGTVGTGITSVAILIPTKGVGLYAFEPPQRNGNKIEIRNKGFPYDSLPSLVPG